jgi:hypothetical protein
MSNILKGIDLGMSGIITAGGTKASATQGRQLAENLGVQSEAGKRVGSVLGGVAGLTSGLLGRAGVNRMARDNNYVPMVLNTARMGGGAYLPALALSGVNKAVDKRSENENKYNRQIARNLMDMAPI